MKRHFLSDRLQAAVASAIRDADFDKLLKTSEAVQTYLDKIAERDSKKRSRKMKGMREVPLPIEYIAELKADGMKIVDIALKFNVSESVIQKRLAKYSKSQ